MIVTMHPIQSAIAPIPQKLAACSFALLATFAATDSVLAQIPQAIYPLATDLLDATSTYGPVMLLGTTPPAPPNNGVCTNGIYLFSGNPLAQDVRTPVITTLNTNDFQIEVEFQINALAGNRPILVGGNGWRWIGFYAQANGTFGILYNNSLYSWSTTTVNVGTWYSAAIKYEAGNVELFLDGIQVLAATIGVLNTSTNLNFTTSNFSNGTAFNGCIRKLVISNDATLGLASMATATNYGAGCDGLTLDANGLPFVGNLGFEFIVSNVPATSPVAFLAFGSAAVSPGIDLTVLGMAGCFSNTSFDLGLFGPVIVVGGSSNFPLPIVPLPSLAGSKLAAQGVSFSTATTLGLAASNGTKITVGL